MCSCRLKTGDNYNMALPKLNDTPKYDLVIPSTNEKVRFRPYLVKEEKVLMMSIEAQDTQKALQAIVDTIEACVQDDLPTNRLTTFDIEYMFTQIRSKSVGETSTVSVECKECKKPIELTIPLSDIKVDIDPKISYSIQLTDTITLKMKWPSYKDLIDLNIAESTDIADSFKVIAKCIESVQTPEENISMKDESDEEISNFIDSLTTDQFDKLRQFVEAMPKLEHIVQVECPHCKHKEERILTGINNFF